MWHRPSVLRPLLSSGDVEALTEADVVGRAREAILHNKSGPMAKDMPYTPDTDGTLLRLAALQPRTIALMHGSTFRGNGERALLDLATVIRETLGTGWGRCSIDRPSLA